ncbi:MAG: hypothetical protein DRQ46_10200 [Gammaproteobacteria bacterium]|nr:MAG: hypothetical protein DRQ46_10200 [Gammaproteobacteria bacterium]
MKDERHECPGCHVTVDKGTGVCPTCGVGIPKGSTTPQTQSQTSFNPGGDKATCCDLAYEGKGYKESV